MDLPAPLHVDTAIPLKTPPPNLPTQSKPPAVKTFLAGPEGETTDDDEDPTDALTDRMRDAYPSLLSEFDHYADQLRTKGILVIASAHSNLASSAAILISGASQLGGARPRRLANWDSSLASLLNRQNRLLIGATGGEGGGKNVVLLIHVYRTQHLEQTYDLLNDRLQQAFSQEDNFHVIIVIFDEAQRGLQPSRLGHSFPVWTIDAKRHLLLHYGYSPGELPPLLAQLDSVRKGGWSGDDSDFMFWLEEELRNKNLQAALQRPLPPPASPVSGAGLVASASKVERCVLFAATMFSRIRIGEFEALVGALAKPEKVPVPALPGHPPLPPEDGQTYWQNNAQEIFQKFMLEIQREAGQPAVVDFRQPSLRKSLQDAFFPTDVIRWLNRLYEDGILANLSRSRSVISRLIELTGEQALDHGDVFDRHWLMTRYRAMATKDANSPGAARRRWHGQSNFLSLCRTFLSHDSTRAAVSEFVEDLIRDTQPDCDAVLEIIIRLSPEENFDAGKYYFQLLNSGNTFIRLRILRRQLSEMRDHKKNPVPGTGFNVIHLVAGWLPSTAAKNLGSGHRWALAFLYSLWEDYRDWSLAQGALDHDVPVPWLEVSPDAPSLADRLDIIKAWFADPRLPAAVEELIRIITFDLRSDTLGSVHWELMSLYYSPRSVGEALVVEALAGFYIYSGHECWLEIADHLRTTLTLKARENLQALIRQHADIPLDEEAKKSRAAFDHHKIHLKRAYQLEQRLLVEPRNLS